MICWRCCGNTLIGDNLQERIVAQTASVVGIFVPGHDLIDV